jgi:hypothetical protein
MRMLKAIVTVFDKHAVDRITRSTTSTSCQMSESTATAFLLALGGGRLMDIAVFGEVPEGYV